MRPLIPVAVLLRVAALTFFLPWRLAAEPLPTLESDAVVSGGSFPNFVVPLPDGSRYMAGDGFVLKLSPGGDVAWNRTVADMVRGLAVDASGNAYVAATDFSGPFARLYKFSTSGELSGTVDLPINEADGECCVFSGGVAVDPVRGRVYAAYNFGNPIGGNYNIKIAVLDTDLNILGVRIHSPEFMYGTGLIAKGGTFVDSQGDVWVA
ncbi:MAG: hypothetical protein AAB262_07265, partial [Elusimicrobiota bacterium]